MQEVVYRWKHPIPDRFHTVRERIRKGHPLERLADMQMMMKGISIFKKFSDELDEDCKDQKKQYKKLVKKVAIHTERIREKMPIQKHRRYDLFAIGLAEGTGGGGEALN